MRKEKQYPHIHFSTETLSETLRVFEELSPKDKRDNRVYSYGVRRGDEGWYYDTQEELFADYRKGCNSSFVSLAFPPLWSFTIHALDWGTSVTISTDDRWQLERIYEIFEKGVPGAIQLDPNSGRGEYRLFIGHGQSPLWKDLIHHLHHQHGFPVESYETGSRAGHTIRDILESMMTKSAFALLVMTGEDETTEGGLRARQNVIHEIGLFQGHLGFSKAIVLLEEGCEEFSNLAGIQQIRFSKGNIREAYGDILAAIDRERRKA